MNTTKIAPDRLVPGQGCIATGPTPRGSVAPIEHTLHDMALIARGVAAALVVLAQDGGK